MFQKKFSALSLFIHYWWHLNDTKYFALLSLRVILKDYYVWDWKQTSIFSRKTLKKLRRNDWTSNNGVEIKFDVKITSLSLVIEGKFRCMSWIEVIIVIFFFVLHLIKYDCISWGSALQDSLPIRNSCVHFVGLSV